MTQLKTLPTYDPTFSLNIFYGDRAQEYEVDIKQALLAVEPSGQFTEELRAKIHMVWKHEY